MAFTSAPVRDPFDKDLRASRSWVAWFAEVQQTITNLVSGSVTSVGLALPSQFTVSGSPVTGAGTLTGAWKNQTANAFLGGPASGPDAAPDFRNLTTADIPALAYDPLGAAATVQTNLNTHTGLTGTSVHGLGNWSVVNYPTWASGTPFVKMTAAGTFALDTSTYLTPGSAASTYVPYTGGTADVDLGAHNLTVDTNTFFVDATHHAVGLGTTSLKSWASTWVSLQLGPEAVVWSTPGSIALSMNAYYDGSWKRLAADYGTQFFMYSGNFVWRNAITSTAGSAISWIPLMQLFTTGGLALGSGSDPGAGNLSAVGNVAGATFSVGATAGIDATITTGSLVGKTITVSKGLITSFA